MLQMQTSRTSTFVLCVAKRLCFAREKLISITLLISRNAMTLGSTNGSEEKLDAVEEIRDELHSIYNKIENVLETSEVYDLASFEINHRINELLQTDYAMEAYEENLENCIEKASDAAILELLDLANIAEENLKLSHQYLKTFLNKYDELLSYFKEFKLVKQNSEIDNT